MENEVLNLLLDGGAYGVVALVVWRVTKIEAAQVKILDTQNRILENQTMVIRDALRKEL